MVRTYRQAMPPIRHWIFQANPDFHDLRENVKQLQVGDTDDWAANQYRQQLQPGDRIALWQSRRHQGIYALGELTSAPEWRTTHSPWQIKAGRTDQPPGWTVDYRITHLFPAGIPRDVIKQDARLSNLLILRRATGTNFSVTPDEWAALEDLAQQSHAGVAAAPVIYRLREGGQTVDAALEIEDATIILHSSGGAKGSRTLNPDYARALRLLLARLAAAGVHIREAWVDSNRVQQIPQRDRLILTPAERGLTPEAQFSHMTAAMESVGQAPGTNGKGNRRKRIRLQLEEPVPQSELVAVLEAVPAEQGNHVPQRLSAADMDKVTDVHLFHAVERLKAGDTAHGFGPSTEYDVLLDDGTRLAPKAVFGMAASEALDASVGPKDFTGGVDSQCVRVLREAGYTIVTKGQERPADPVPPSPEDAAWTEGSKVLVTHLRRERASGLAQAKKADFVQKHGHLRCEHCGMVPSERYGEHGDACIEVHHYAVQVKDMAGAHRTVLDDLQCLCANCHRVEHRRLKADLLLERAAR